MKFDFTKNRTVDNIESVPENFRAFYEKSENAETFTLRTDDVTTAAVAAIAGLNRSLTAARSDADAAKKNNTPDLSALSAYGTTIEEIAAGVEKKVNELQDQKDHNQRSVSERISQIQKEHTQEIQKLTADKDAELQAKDAKLHNYMLDQAITTAAATWSGLNPVLVAPFARNQMAVAVVDEEARVVVVDDKGEARYSKMPERAGALMQPDELLVEMSEKDNFKQLFPSKQASQGGGSHQTRVPAGVRRTDNTANMSPAEKITAGLGSISKK